MASTLAAAKALGVNQSTVHGRLSELETRAVLALVKRHPIGFRLTELGGALIDHILAVETAVVTLERKIQALADDFEWPVEPRIQEGLAALFADLFGFEAESSPDRIHFAHRA